MDRSAEYFRYWGKADSAVEGALQWHPFAYHSLDVAAVAGAFWEQSPAIRRAFSESFGPEETASGRLRAWVLFFVALHDLGKLHALFQIKAPHALALAWPELDPKTLINKAPKGYYDHGSEGFRLAMSELSTWTNKSDRRWLKAWSPWLGAVTGHHGEIPGNDKPIAGYADQPIREQDASARHEWFKEAAGLFLTSAGLSLADHPPPCSHAARNLLAGFCSLCDWIGSNSEVFRYTAPGMAPVDYFNLQTERISDDDILRRFGLIAPAKVYQGVSALLKTDEAPRGIQVMIDGLSTAAGLTIVEAPTGSGKTEAALAYAWRLLDAGIAESIVFALPTQATANAMLARCQVFAGEAFGRANLVLAHGHRALNPEYQRLVEAGTRKTSQGQEEASVQCAAWLASSRKRVFLGQIGVCTIDQVLLSVLPVRHNFVRAFGLHRSVLIVDEVHAYDAYMNGLLGEVLKRQKATGGSAVLLSATLPARIRNRLLAAWDTEPGAEQAPYPAIWSTPDLSVSKAPLTVPESEFPPERPIDVTLSKLPGAFPDTALIQRIIDGAESGALVGLVMNTVDDAQRLTRLLQGKTQIPVDLFHARFRLKDRQGIEQGVIACYGRQAPREHGRILVATQVIEQSLDLDFDWLITQLCPVDLLFQRLGRLHRHPRVRPVGFEHPTCTVLSVDTGDYGLHELIYGDARLLWRTERLLAQRPRIVFPEAYRGWIEPVYEEAPWDDEPETIYGNHMAWRDDQASAAAKAIQLTTMNLTQFRDEDERATSLTRDGEMSLTILPLLSNGCLLDGNSLDGMDEYAKAEAVMLNAVPAPRSWQSRLSGYEHDDEGRIRLPLENRDGLGWASSDGSLVYSAVFGLAKGEAAGLDDPPLCQPR